MSFAQNLMTVVVLLLAAMAVVIWLAMRRRANDVIRDAAIYRRAILQDDEDIEAIVDDVSSKARKYDELESEVHRLREAVQRYGKPQ